MYWIFFIFFIIGVLVPDIVRNDVGFFSEERVEEMIIFALGVVGFSIFLLKDKQLFFERKQKEEGAKKLDRTSKDLLKSYSYIGEVNRKMDMLMGLALGLYSRSKINAKEEKEFYLSVANASKILLKGKACSLFFINVEKEKILKDVHSDRKFSSISAKELSQLGGSVNVKKKGGFIAVASPNRMNKLRSYLIINDYDKEEEAKPKNIEILKVLASQALFIFSSVSKLSK